MEMSINDQIWFTLSLGGVLILFEGAATWIAYKFNSFKNKEKAREFAQKSDESFIKIPVGMFLYFLFQSIWLIQEKDSFAIILVVILLGVIFSGALFIVAFTQGKAKAKP